MEEKYNWQRERRELLEGQVSKGLTQFFRVKIKHGVNYLNRALKVQHFCHKKPTPPSASDFFLQCPFDKELPSRILLLVKKKQFQDKCITEFLLRKKYSFTSDLNKFSYGSRSRIPKMSIWIRIRILGGKHYLV